MQVTLIQMNSQENKEANVDEAERLIDAAVKASRPDLVILPEYFAFLSGKPAEQRASGEDFKEGKTFRRLAGIARRHQVTLHAGSMVEIDNGKHYNTTAVFGPTGEVIAKYRKIHLFDVVVPGGLRYLESEMVSRGEQVVTYMVGDLKVGCAICYDIRFPELFRKLRDLGADVIVLPAAFTSQTGKDHWEILARARAIETQTYFCAIGQIFSHAGGIKSCWGHSMVIDPWGHIVSQASDRIGHTTADLDKAYVDEVRRNIPLANHHVLE